MEKENTKISVIIPAYNSAEYIAECLESIINQTMPVHEIIVVNDGSTDNTEEILKEYSSRHSFIKYINQENSGQGNARNNALNKATGEYVMFVDSDDFIKPDTLERCTKRIMEAGEKQPDILAMDYMVYYGTEDRYAYHNRYKFLKYGSLDDRKKIKSALMSVASMFTTTLMCKRRFLLDNKIRYGEGYIYEDMVYWVHAAMTCERLVTVYAPLYVIRVNKDSTTRGKIDTYKHGRDFITAISESKLFLNNEDVSIKRQFIKFTMNKYFFYRKKRIPAKYHKEFEKNYIETIADFPIRKIEPDETELKIIRKLSRVLGLDSNRIMHKAILFKQMKMNEKERVRKETEENRPKVKTLNALSYEQNKLLVKPTVLFYGFDLRYIGNSRYLFEEMIEKKFSYEFYFATEDEFVDKKYRVKPNSERFYELLYSSAVVIFESWIPKRFKKPNNKIWINLWHGTPFKKLLFDTPEFYICNKSKDHKKNSYYSLRKMDYILTDNDYVKKYFMSSFMLNEDRFITFGYPRVRYLLENKNNTKLKIKIREKLGIGREEKVFAYLPTWRDYNYKLSEDKQDFSYVLDVQLLEDKLPNNYTIVSKEYPFGTNTEISNDIETQELLLISDCVITDYSSVMFDAFAYNIPVVLYETDYEKFKMARDVYVDMRKDLSPFIAYNIDELSEIILNYNVECSEYKNVQKKYGNNSTDGLIPFIESNVERCVNKAIEKLE